MCEKWLRMEGQLYQEGAAVIDPKDLPFAPVRKKPVVVQAVKVNEFIMISTREGAMMADPGDYIIRGVKGEYYPCKPDIFELTYESASAGATAFISEGARRIIVERHRQVNDENYDAKHDRQHEDGELVYAAIAYAAAPERMYGLEEVRSDRFSEFYFSQVWPGTWDEHHDKRGKHGRIRRLEIAGALLAAEIDRLLAEEPSHLEVPAP